MLAIWLRDLPMGPAEVEDFLLAHGSVLDEDEYLIDAQDAANQFPHVLGRVQRGPGGGSSLRPRREEEIQEPLLDVLRGVPDFAWALLVYSITGSGPATGIAAIIQPGGSMRDEEVIQAANEHGLAMVFTGMRHFRH